MKKLILILLLVSTSAFAQVSQEEIAKNIELAQKAITEDKGPVSPTAGTDQKVEIQDYSSSQAPAPATEEAAEGVNLSDLTPEERTIYDELKKGVVAVQEKKGINRVNSNYRIKRGDNRIVSEFTSVDDVHEIKTCYGNPIVISFGKSIPDKISVVKNGNVGKFSHEVEPSTSRTVTISLNAPADASIQGHFWIFRERDNRRYNFHVIGEPCPSNGIYTYPFDITIEESKEYAGTMDRLLLPTDFMSEVTQNYRRDNAQNFVNTNGLMTTATGTYTSLGVSISLKDYKGQAEVREPRFIAVNWSKTSKIGLSQEYLPFSSQGESDLNQIPTLRFNLKLEYAKKNIIERKIIYLIIMYDDTKTYQIAEVPLMELLKQLKDKGWEI